MKARGYKLIDEVEAATIGSLCKLLKHIVEYCDELEEEIDKLKEAKT